MRQDAERRDGACARRRLLQVDERRVGERRLLGLGAQQRLRVRLGVRVGGGGHERERVVALVGARARLASEPSQSARTPARNRSAAADGRRPEGRRLEGSGDGGGGGEGRRWNWEWEGRGARTGEEALVARVADTPEARLVLDASARSAQHRPSGAGRLARHRSPLSCSRYCHSATAGGE